MASRFGGLYTFSGDRESSVFDLDPATQRSTAQLRQRLERFRQRNFDGEASTAQSAQDNPIKGGPNTVELWQAPVPGKKALWPSKIWPRTNQIRPRPNQRPQAPLPAPPTPVPVGRKEKYRRQIQKVPPTNCERPCECNLHGNVG